MDRARTHSRSPENLQVPIHIDEDLEFFPLEEPLNGPWSRLFQSVLLDLSIVSNCIEDGLKIISEFVIVKVGYMCIAVVANYRDV